MKTIGSGIGSRLVNVRFGAHYGPKSGYCTKTDKGQERTFPAVADFLKLTDTSAVYPSCKGYELVIEAIWLLQEGRMPHAIEP